MAKKTAAKKKTAGKKASAKKAKGQAAEPTMTKAAFVRSMPADMPAKDVIAKAKEAGLVLNDMTVYKTRSLDKKGSGKKAGRTPKKLAAKAKGASGSPKARGKAPDKKNRVLELKAQNPDWSADQIASAAKCSTTYVYSVWGGSKKRGASTNGSAKSKIAASSASNGAVTDFYRVLKKVGVAKAKELIANIEAFQNA